MPNLFQGQEIRIHLACDPPTATSQQKGVATKDRAGRPLKLPRFFKRANVEASEKMLSLLLLPHRLAKPLRGPLRLHITYVFPWRTTEPLKNRGEPLYKSTKPDLENSAKGLIDVMAKLAFFYDGDQQIADLHIEKFWGDTPGIDLVIQEIL